MATVTPVLCVTRDEQGAPAVTIATIYSALFRLQRTPQYFQNGALGYALARTTLFRSTMETLGVPKTRGFLLDDDIRIVDQKALMKVITFADAMHYNVVAPYRARNGRFSIIKRIPMRASGTCTQLLDETEMSQVAPYAQVEMAGLGFYYGDIPLDYVFHEGIPYTGEDLNFFHDNKSLEPRLAPLYVEHIKQAVLPGVRYETK